MMLYSRSKFPSLENEGYPQFANEGYPRLLWETVLSLLQGLVLSLAMITISTQQYESRSFSQINKDHAQGQKEIRSAHNGDHVQENKNSGYQTHKNMLKNMKNITLQNKNQLARNSTTHRSYPLHRVTKMCTTLLVHIKF